MTQNTAPQENKEMAQLRRAPKYFPFLISGGAVGLLVALVLFLATGSAATTDWLSILGILVLFVSAIGAFAGVILCWYLDKRSLKHFTQIEATLHEPE